MRSGVCIGGGLWNTNIGSELKRHSSQRDLVRNRAARKQQSCCRKSWIAPSQLIHMSWKTIKRDRDHVGDPDCVRDLWLVLTQRFALISTVTGARPVENLQ